MHDWLHISALLGVCAGAQTASRVRCGVTALDDCADGAVIPAPDVCPHLGVAVVRVLLGHTAAFPLPWKVSVAANRPPCHGRVLDSLGAEKRSCQGTGLREGHDPATWILVHELRPFPTYSAA